MAISISDAHIGTKSISQAQAEALEAQFFGPEISEEAVTDHFIRTRFAEDHDDHSNYLVPRKSFGALIQLAGFLVGTAQQNLVDVNRVDTGKLSESLKIINPQVINGTVMQVDIEANFYYQFVDLGVRGTRGGNGYFQFRNEHVSKKMLAAIHEWVKREGIKGTSDRMYRGISKREDRRKKLADSIEAGAKTKSIAYAIAKAVKIKGLKRTNFFSNALNETGKAVDEYIGKAFSVDIMRSLPNKI